MILKSILTKGLLISEYPSGSYGAITMLSPQQENKKDERITTEASVEDLLKILSGSSNGKPQPPPLPPKPKFEGGLTIEVAKRNPAVATESLQEEVSNINKKLMNLTTRVLDLENQLDACKKENNYLLSRSATTNFVPSPSATTNRYRTFSPSLKKVSIAGSTSNITQNSGTNANLSCQWPSHSNFVSPSLKKGSIAGSTSNISQISGFNPNLSSQWPSHGNFASPSLKKGSIAGSTSNISQIGGFSANLSTQWPSQSNFVETKNQAKDVLYDDEERVIRMVLYNTLITMRLPSWLDSDYYFDKLIEPPAVKLKLDWVYGYRGRDCRSNIFYLPTGECVYFIASVVVLYNPDKKTQRHYLGHTANVKCLAVHPNKLIVASGQSSSLNSRDKRPIVRIWNTVSLATLRVIGFNEDYDRPICCLAFSHHDHGASLVVVDESSEHTITLLDWQREKNWRVAEANSGHEPVLAIDFHPIDKSSIVAVGRASINFWDVRGTTLAKKAGLFDKYDRPKYVICFTFNDLGETITGDSNGNIIIWPRGSNKPKRIIRDVHYGGVFSILALKDGNYLTGGRDRRIIEWDENFEPTGRQAELPEHCGGIRFITYGKGLQVLIGTIRNCLLVGSLDTEFTLFMQGHTEATTALAVHPNQRKYLTGGFDEQIHLIDCDKHQIEWSKCMMQPITAASFSPNGLILILGSTSGSWIVLDSLTQDVIFEVSDGTGTITCIKFSNDGSQFCFGSSDNQVYVYETSGESYNIFKQIGICIGHTAPIKEIDWSEDNLYIQSQSMNFELFFWRADSCLQTEDDMIVHELKWSTQNCTIGFNTIGMWPDSSISANGGSSMTINSAVDDDPMLIIHCDRSHQGDLMVASTDTGYINVYKAPTYYNQCLSNKYFANVDKLNNIKFLYDDSKLIAIGAKNCVTTEWIIDRRLTR